MGNDDLSLTFFGWLVRGSGGRRGYKRILNKWLVLHGLIGTGLALCISTPLSRAAQNCLLPAFSILIGLTFAWVGNSQGLLQARSTRELGRHHAGGWVDYIFAYQLSVFVLLFSIAIFTVISLSPCERINISKNHQGLYFLVKICFYSVASQTLATVWNTVNGSHYLLRAGVILEDARDEVSRRSK